MEIWDIRKYIPIESIYGIPSRELTHPIWGKGNHLQNAIFGGYVSSMGGIYLHLVDFYGKCRKIYQSHGSYGDRYSIFSMPSWQRRLLLTSHDRGSIKKHKLNQLGKVRFLLYTPPKLNSSPLKSYLPKRIVFEPSIFRGELLNFRWVNFRGRSIRSHIKSTWIFLSRPYLRKFCLDLYFARKI